MQSSESSRGRRKMKQKISITIDGKNVKEIEKIVGEGRFRNKSHAVEYAVVKLLNEILQERGKEKKK